MDWSGVINRVDWSVGAWLLLAILLAIGLLRARRSAQEMIQAGKHSQSRLRRKLMASLENPMFKLFRLLGITVAFLLLVKLLGFDISGILAVGGISGIVVGIAARDMLANFIGGVLIYLDEPFTVGDWIRSPDREIEGIVQEVGWRITRLVTLEGRPMYIPNSVFLQVVIENPARMKTRRIHEVVGLRYSDAGRLEAVVEGINALLGNHPDIDRKQEIVVRLSRFSASALDLVIWCHATKPAWEEYSRIKHEVLMGVARVIEAQGASIAFPTSTIRFSGETELAIRQGAA